MYIILSFMLELKLSSFYRKNSPGSYAACLRRDILINNYALTLFLYRRFPVHHNALCASLNRWDSSWHAVYHLEGLRSIRIDKVNSYLPFGVLLIEHRDTSVYIIPAWKLQVVERCFQSVCLYLINIANLRL